MDEKTVIAGRGGKPAEPAKPAAEDPADLHATVIAPRAPLPPAEGKKPAAPGKPAAPAKGAKAGPTAAQAKDKKAARPTASAKAAPPSTVPVVALLAFALVLIGLGSAMTTIYLLTPDNQQVAQVEDQDLQADIVALQSEASEAEDEALIKAAIKPRIIDLSGDPVIVRQLANAPRQLLKLEQEPQRKSAEALGIKGDVFRLKDVLDVPNSGIQSGAFGSQDDISVAQPAETDGVAATVTEGGEEGSSVIVANGGDEASRIAEFAQTAKAKEKISERLRALGFDAEAAQSAEDAFVANYGRSTLNPGDKFAVRATGVAGAPNQLRPVQVSLYGEDELIGSIALNDIEVFAKAEDPWYQRDIFEAQLLPEDANPENQPRLLDAIYAAALRNRIPTAVVGETIMLLSRAQDLEQKVQPGDTITLVYSPNARDSKSGLGRVVFVSIGRTSGNLDCYVMQASAGAQFECVSTGGESSVDEDGMVTPVAGVIVAKFGPQGAAADGPMNFGVDWTAPKGSPVIAAFAGQVASVGPEKDFGMTVRLSHADGKATMYGYLSRPAPGIVAGASVTAGQTIGFVGTPASSREPRLHFELRRNGEPVDPVGEMQASVGAGGPIDHFVKRIIYIESANRCDARNPLSTAVGLGQFIESTWMTTIRLHRPDLLNGRTRRQVLDLRTNCELARAMTTAFTRDNAAVIRQAGHPVTPGHLYLAHFLGVGGAIKVLRSDPNRQIAEVFGEAHVRANPFERGKSIGYLVSWASKKMGGKTPSKPIQPGKAVATAAADTAVPAAEKKKGAAVQPGVKDRMSGADAAGAKDAKTESATAAAGAADPGEPLAKYAADPVFSKLKDAVTTFLQ